GRRSGLGGGSGDDVLFGGAGSDAVGVSLSRLGGNAEAAAQAFAKLAEQGKRFEALTGPLAKGLAENNALFVSQADRLRGLGVLLPDIGRQLIDVFDSGTVGAERLDKAVQAVGKRFLDAFEGAIRRGESLGDVLKSLARDLADLALNEVKTGGLGGLFDILGGLFGSAKGNAFSRGHTLTAYARGGAFTNTIVDRPTLFPMAAGAGLMGEAGPEAVLPLTRLANGELGVQTPAPEAVAAGPVITYNIDARGADREGLSRLAAVVRQQGATINYINRTLERRAVEAMVYTRGRGGNIARAFGGW
ncbi:MAG: phage tail tape measure protein, partial [Proteobacteria bacterium]|nr:phage tail tape measure protein [Pseudomonadota bacterium]